MVRLNVVLAFAVVVAAPQAFAADPLPCYLDFYRTHDVACIDHLIAPDAGLLGKANDIDTTKSQTMVGLFAGLFAADAAQRDRILAMAATPREHAIFTEALVRAGVPEKAKSFAEEKGLGVLAPLPALQKLAPLADVHPHALAGDNDLLLGAYMATGDTAWVERLLDNFRSADDGMVRDALRIGMMMSRFGPGLAPPGRRAVIAQTACEKYRCLVDPEDTLRVMTLATAFWSIRSLSRSDDGVGKTADAFVQANPRIADLVAAESGVFARYVRLVTAPSAAGTSGDEPLLTAFETLKPMSTLPVR
jgi:hypothetical protein